MSVAIQAVKHFRIRAMTEAPRPANARIEVPNPFIPHKNPKTGRWAPARYSLRQQADLVKHARACGMVHLLPPGPKLSSRDLQSVVAAVPASRPTATAPVTVSSESSNVAPEATREGEWWEKEVTWAGEFKEKEVKGADVGNRLYAGKKRMFKGHKWERTLEKRTWERKVLMKDMKARIERFRTTYRRKTPSPTSPARPVAYSKLPF